MTRARLQKNTGSFWLEQMFGVEAGSVLLLALLLSERCCHTDRDLYCWGHFLGCSGIIILSWAERRVHGPPCAGFWEAVPALPLFILSEPALPRLPCVLGSLHTVLLAFFSNGTHLSDGELCKCRCKLDSAPGCLASRLAVLSLLENCAPLLLQGKLSSVSFLFFFPL